MSTSTLTPPATTSPPTQLTVDAPGASRRVCIVGSGPRFLSGISYYTSRLSASLAASCRVSVILMRQLLPTALYPGATRVGADLAQLDYGSAEPVLDGVNWWWGGSLAAAIRHLRAERPEFVVFQWWTGTVLHTYLALALIARAMGIKVIVEFHELLDTGELQIAAARWYVRALAPQFLKLSDGFVVHNEFDRRSLIEAYGIDRRPVRTVFHGPYDQYVPTASAVTPSEHEGDITGPFRLLYFGVIRPFKGVEDIVDALDLMTDEEAERIHLTIVGETWEGWTVPAERIAASRRRDRITFVNRYVADAEVADLFASADAVVLPYHRSSSSGPLHIAMASGLPVIVSAVGGLVEASTGYAGAIRVPPRDASSLRRAIGESIELRGQRFADPHSWLRTVDGYTRIFDDLETRAVRGR